MIYLKIIVAFVVVSILSRYIEDRCAVCCHLIVKMNNDIFRWQVISGLVCELAGFVWMIATLGQATEGMCLRCSSSNVACTAI